MQHTSEADADASQGPDFALMSLTDFIEVQDQIAANAAARKAAWDMRHKSQAVALRGNELDPYAWTKPFADTLDIMTSLSEAASPLPSLTTH
jgi:hypothetical protein